MTETTDFAAFYAATFPSLCAALYVHTGNLPEAQDVVQEAFVRAMPRWQQLRDYEDPVAWVRKVAWNLATSRWRRARRLVSLNHPDAEHTIPELSPDRVALRNALATLPPRQREAVVLHYLADLPISEVATLTGAAEGTVKSWLHRARASLASQLSEGVPAQASSDTVTATLTEDDVHAVEALRDAALPHVRPPGTAAARRTMRRREATRMGAAVVLAVLMVAAALATLPGRSRPAPINPPWTPPPSVSTLSPTATATVTSEPTPTTAAAANGGGSGSGCTPRGMAQMTYLEWSSDYNAMMVQIAADTTGYSRICPGETIRAFWAVYTWQSDNSQTLYRSAEFQLTLSSPSVISYLPNSPGCAGIKVFVTGDSPILQNIPAGVQNPYPDYSAAKHGGLISSTGGGYCPGTTPTSPTATPT